MPTGHNASVSRSIRGHCSTHARLSTSAPISPIQDKQDLPSRWESKNQRRTRFDCCDTAGLALTRACADLLRVLVADDHPVVREGLVSLIRCHADMEVVAQARNGAEAVEQFLKYRPDVALLDLRMPIANGITALISICEKEPSARIAIISSYQLEEDIYGALRSGALGYIPKEATQEQLAECLRSVAEGRTWVPPQIGAKLARRVADRELTRREVQVLSAVAAGKSNKEIGATFNISEATVKVHVTHLLEKLKVTGRTEAINVAVKRGLVHLDLAAAA
jgi:two-component system NarL family response regulator